MTGDPRPTLPARRRLRRVRALLVGVLATVLLGTGLPVAAAQVYSSPATGSHDVVGAILERYRASGGPAGVHGYPVTGERSTPGGRGRYNHFETGSIYWSPTTGAHSVLGAIRDRWAQLGWERGPLGFPVTSDRATPHRPGSFTVFEAGSVYWSRDTGAHAVVGAIRDEWGRLGWEDGLLGFPRTDERSTPGGRGRYNHFETGSIYWSPTTGAHAVLGVIRDRWAQLGWERGLLGFPVTGEQVTPNRQGIASHFERGSIYWSSRSGAHAVHGAIRERWRQLGWENSALGFPVSDEYSVPGGRAQDFQYGSITWTPGAGAVVTGAPRAGGGILPLGVRPPGTQAVTVTAAPGATTGTLTAWELRGGTWAQVLTTQARLGAAGIGAASESSTRTPQGTWTMTEAFGRLANPGTALPYRHVDGDDWWISDVRSPRYNEYAQCARGTCPFDERASENLAAAGLVYDHAVVLDYNRPGVPGAGSAFFLHITNNAPTAGCVAIDRTSLVTLVRWLRPEAQPVISIGIA
ncbi:hypothetical protein [Blastococcus sp. SYSU D00813]